MNQLPIESILPELASALQKNGRAVLCAAPGAGKTTVVPQFLLKELFSNSFRKIVMLEPRRIAARAAARRIALILHEKMGKTVGYRTRLDSCISAETRIEIVTEGILTRMLQNDPALEKYGLIIFDEFHERSIHADLALALALDSIAVLRPDLKLLVMSATLDAERISTMLDHAPVIQAPGRMFPVKTIYVPKKDRPVWIEAASAIRSAVASNAPGDLLVFLPGEGEIRRTEALFAEKPLPGTVILPLYGTLSASEQDSALQNDPEGRRKVILSTSIAETSLTIDGIATVIDCGLMRVPKFSPRNGMNRLETIPVSRASADQRRGRAGRTMPGVCIRLWSEQEDQRLVPFNPPGILESDLAPVLLELAAWGVDAEHAAGLQWLDAPPDSKLRQASEVLTSLGALDKTGHISEHGRHLLELPVHPRLAHAILSAKQAGFGYTACIVSAVLSERESSGKTCDLCVKIQELLRENSNQARRIRESAKQIAHSAAIPAGAWDENALGIILAFAFPDRIGHWRQPKSGEYALSNGTGAKLRYSDHLAFSEFIAAASVEGEGAKQTVFSAAAIRKEDLFEFLTPLIRESDEAEWDSENESVQIRHTVRLGKMLISAGNAIGKASTDEIAAVFFAGIRAKGISAFPFEQAEQNLRERVNFVRLHLPACDMPDLSDEALLDGLEKWLAPFTENFTRLAQLKKLDFKMIFAALFTHAQQVQLKKFAPERITVPTGSRIKVDYSSPDGVPTISVRLQELFGMLETPRIADGSVPIVIKMLSPAMRPVQVTSDLRSFWNESYFLVRKDLRGRYPKHYWPENPLEAEPTRRVKPAGK